MFVISDYTVTLQLMVYFVLKKYKRQANLSIVYRFFLTSMLFMYTFDMLVGTGIYIL